MTHSPLYTSHQSPSVRRPPHRPLGLILGSIALATFALMPQERLSPLLPPLSGQQRQAVQSWPTGQSLNNKTCQTVLDTDRRLSRGQLTQFLSVAKSSSQATVHQTIAPPYCRLSKENQPQQQEAYPLAFDPDTWFVVNYDQGTYTGYDFIFRK
ncbi:MAG: hypothetical protein F6K31_37100 [Symploca sp. SIO2G7]|nr:hypothetical protein [Symploca sp. SIO2G7]